MAAAAVVADQHRSIEGPGVRGRRQLDEHTDVRQRAVERLPEDPH